MKRQSRLDYAFAVGRIRVLERKLITREVFTQATEEKDFPQAIKIIFDAGEFKDEMVNLRTSDELDNFLHQEEEDLSLLMNELLLEEELKNIIEREVQPDEALTLANKNKLDYRFIINYLKHKIDLVNLKILCRAKYLGLPVQKIDNLLLGGGYLDKKLLASSYELSYPEIGDKISFSAYFDLWSRSTSVLQEKETFIELERSIEDFLMLFLRQAKYVVFGPEPIFAYIQAKRRELSLVRLVGIGKLIQIPGEILKKRISETYV